MTNADISTKTKNILLVRQNSFFFYARRFYTLYEQKYLNLRPVLFIGFPQGFRKSRKFGHWNSGSGGKKTLKWSEQRGKKSVKAFFAAAMLDHVLAKMFKSETTSFHYISPRIPNLLNFWTSDFGKWGQKDV